MRILMVCLGNICRSPIAEGIMQHKINEHGLDWEVDSASTNVYHTGEPPHRYSQEICKLNGIDISDQRARRFQKSDLDQYDKIYVMANDVYEDVQHILNYKDHEGKVVLFLDELEDAKGQSVPDPYYGGKDGFVHVYELIDRTCNTIIEKYNQQ